MTGKLNALQKAVEADCHLHKLSSQKCVKIVAFVAETGTMHMKEQCTATSNKPDGDCFSGSAHKKIQIIIGKWHCSRRASSVVARTLMYPHFAPSSID